MDKKKLFTPSSKLYVIEKVKQQIKQTLVVRWRSETLKTELFAAT